MVSTATNLDTTNAAATIFTSVTHQLINATAELCLIRYENKDPSIAGESSLHILLGKFKQYYYYGIFGEEHCVKNDQFAIHNNNTCVDNNLVYVTKHFHAFWKSRFKFPEKTKPRCTYSFVHAMKMGHRNRLMYNKIQQIEIQWIIHCAGMAAIFILICKY